MDGNGQHQNDPRRATAFTKASAAVAGSHGGKKSAESRRKKKALRDVVQAVMDCKVKDDALNERLRESGFLSKNGNATVQLVMAVNLAQIAMSDSPSKTAGTSVKAFEALVRAASGELGTPPPALRIEADGRVGGVVVMPAPDPSLLGEASGDADPQTSGGGEP